LLSLFDHKTKLFSESATLTESGLRRAKVSRRQTAIALLGLERLASSGATHPFDVGSIQDALWNDTRWVTSIEDLGVLTWFAAECCPDRLASLFCDFDFSSAATTYPDAREASTTALAMFLTGIAHARLACPSMSLELTDVAVETYHLLEDNQSEGGIFGHAAFPKYLPQFLCRRFGTFSDQIFSIYALSTFARAFQIEEPLGSALNCANALRDLQGEMGQWWFRYDGRACRVVNRYPVLTLNQDGLAPLGLLAVGESTGQSFEDAIYKGLAWTAGANELNDDLRDLDRRLIWDSIEPIAQAPSYWEALTNLARVSREPQSADVVIRYEARPDHFAWMLCAFGRHGLPKTMSATAARSR
jgi:hypothetical protein